MLTLLLGFAALAIFLLAAKGFVAANPNTLAQLVRMTGGVLAIVIGGLLALTGRAAYGLPLAFLGVSVLLRWSVPGMSGRTARPQGGISRVRSALLAMELDLDSGAMRGAVIAGTYRGRDLDSLDDAELAALAREVRRSDPDGVSLLETYLNRRPSGGREDLKGNARARHRNAPGEGAMTEDEAYQILGLDAGAGAEDIRRAHRALMKKAHPDQGGSDWLASRINQAKDVLLRTRR